MRALRNSYWRSLAADAEALDQVLIAFFVLALGVVQKITTLRHKLEQTTTGVVVFLVRLKVFSQRRNPAGQDRNLDFWRTGVAFLGCEFFDQAVLFFNSDRDRGLFSERFA